MFSTRIVSHVTKRLTSSLLKTRHTVRDESKHKERTRKGEGGGGGRGGEGEERERERECVCVCVCERGGGRKTRMERVRISWRQGRMGEADATNTRQEGSVQNQIASPQKGRNRWTHTDVLWKKQQNKQNKTKQKNTREVNKSMLFFCETGRI